MFRRGRKRTKAAKSNIDFEVGNLLDELYENERRERHRLFDEFIVLLDMTTQLNLFCGNKKLLATTVEDIKQGLCTFSSLTSSSTVRQQKRRSRSFTSDDGYLTADSHCSKNGGGESLRKSKKRRSQSLSYFKENHILNLKGCITPKIEANSAHVMLRRPKINELAFSSEGSPLLVSSNQPNVFIPLEGGRNLCIQPQKGLRCSLLPALDDVTKTQLHTLLDNLNKICTKIE